MLSGATLTQIPVRQLLRDDRRAKLVALAVLAAVVTLAVTLILIPASDDPTPTRPRPGTRSDGGPQEGTRGPATDRMRWQPRLGGAAHSPQ